MFRSAWPLLLVLPTAAGAEARSAGGAPALLRSGVAQWQRDIADAARRFGLPADWIERVMQAESGGRTRLAGVPITSRAGAMGLMQLMPGTWAEMRRTYGLGADPHEPRDNIMAGAAYLRILYDRFGYPGLFAAYNAGPERYAAHLATGRPLPAETRAYVAAVQPGGGMARASRVEIPRQSLFAIPPKAASFVREADQILIPDDAGVEEAATRSSVASAVSLDPLFAYRAGPN